LHCLWITDSGGLSTHGLKLVSWSLTPLFSSNMGYGYIRNGRLGVESYPYPVKDGQQYINLNPGRLFCSLATRKGKGIERLI